MKLRAFPPTELEEGWNLERVRRLRLWLVRKLTAARGDPETSRTTREALEVLLFCENLSAHSHEYLTERPSLERIAETVQRIEETMTDQMETPIAALGATVSVGPALDVRAFSGGKRAARGAADPLMDTLAGEMKALISGMLKQGPPAEWDCLPPVENPAAADNGRGERPA